MIGERSTEIRLAEKPEVDRPTKLVSDILRVKQVWSRHHRPPERCRFEQIVPANRHQAATDKHDVGCGVEQRYVAHGIAKIDFSVRRARYVIGARNEIQPLLLQ